MTRDDAGTLGLLVLFALAIATVWVAQSLVGSDAWRDAGLSALGLR